MGNEMITKIEMIEYVYEGDNFELSFKVFPHITTDESVRKAIKRYFKIDVNSVIDEQFYSDPFLAITYTWATKLYDMKVLMQNTKSTSVILEGIQKHIHSELGLKGIYVAWLNLFDRDLYMKHDGLLY